LFFYESDLNSLNFFNFDRKTDIAIDIGANQGQTTDFLISKFAKVLSFEPIKKNYIFLKKKYKNKKNVRIFNFAVTNKKDEKNIFIPIYRNISLTHCASLYPNIAYSGPLESLNITKKNIILKKEKINTKELLPYLNQNIKLIKIDAEGSEYIIIKNIYNWLKTNSPVLFIEFNKDFKLIKNLLKKINYIAYEFQNNKLKKKLLGSQPLNIIYIKDNTLRIK